MHFLSPLTSAFFKKYIEVDTSDPSGIHYPTCIALLKNLLVQLSFDVEIHPIPQKIALGKHRQHLVGRRFVSHSLPTLLIYNHIDVVPADYPGAFDFRADNTKVYGRGTSDHKGGTVAVLSALEALKNSQLRFNIIFWATTDEETKQLSQLTYMTNKLKLPSNTIVFDTDTFAGGVTIARMGLLGMHIAVQGKSIHSAMSNLGKNAIEDSAKLIVYLQTIKKQYEAQKSAYRAFPSSRLTYVCSRCNVNSIHGGIVYNTIPDRCELKVDCRYIPEADVQKEKITLLKNIDAFCKKNGIDYEIMASYSIEGNGGVSLYAQKLNEIYTSINGSGGLFCILGSSDVVPWVKSLQLPHFGLGVARGDTHVHGKNEFAYIKDIETLDQTLRMFLTYHLEFNTRKLRKNRDRKAGRTIV